MEQLSDFSCYGWIIPSVHRGVGEHIRNFLHSLGTLKSFCIFDNSWLTIETNLSLPNNSRGGLSILDIEALANAGGQVSTVIWAASTMGIVRDWTTHCVALLNMGTTYNEQLERWARNNTGNKKGSIKITRRKIDILTTSRCRSFGRQGGKSGPRYKSRSQTQGAKDLSLIWDEDFGQNMRQFVNLWRRIKILNWRAIPLFSGKMSGNIV